MKLFLLLFIINVLFNEKIDAAECKLDKISCLARAIVAPTIEMLYPEPEPIAAEIIITLNNVTASIGDNATFTCAKSASVFASLFWYQINETGGDIHESNFIQLATPLDPPLAQKYILEKVTHAKDPNTNYETVNAADKNIENFTILNITENDFGAYVCVISNGFSYRLSVAYLSLATPTPSPVPASAVAKPAINMLSVSLITFISILVASFLLLSLFACLHFKYQTNLYKCCLNATKHDGGMFFSKSNGGAGDAAKTHGSLQKGFEAMKHNLLYPYTPTSCFIDAGDNLASSSSAVKRSYYINDVLITSNTNEKLLLNNNNTLSTSSSVIIDPVYVSMIQQLIDDKSYLIPLENINMGKKIGEGAFGFVHCAQIKQQQQQKEAEEDTSSSDVNNKTVAIKMLKENANIQEVKNFIQEMEIMKGVGKHENIVTLLGISTNPHGSLMAIVEYAKYGNLRDYLRNKRMHSYFVFNLQRNISAKNQISNLLTLLSSSTSSHDKEMDESIDFRDLVNFAYQIALGMDYLHTKKLLHRDLAARNVLVCENRVVKIADFGLARDIEQNYYYKRQTDGRLPVKWMAPECLFDRKAYTNSDIWSYGILLWEIFSLGGTPYPSVPVEKLYDYLKQGNRMSKPAYANNEIYNLMLQCWNQNALKRPSFKETSVFLNTQIQKLSKTISSISSYSSLNSHNELKRFNFDSRRHHNNDINNEEEEADDEQTAELFLLNNNSTTDTAAAAADQSQQQLTVNEISQNKKLNRKFLTRSLGESSSTQDSQYCMEDTTASSCNDAVVGERKQMSNENDNNHEKQLFELITRLNGSINGSNSNTDTNAATSASIDADNFTDSNYESASSYYSSTSPNHVNSSEENRSEDKTSSSTLSPNLLSDSHHNDSPLISAKNLLVRMSQDTKPFYMNHTSETPKILISPSIHDENYDEFVN